MGWNIRPSKLDMVVKGSHEKHVRATVLAVIGQLKNDSPVDTGLFKGNWQTKIAMIPPRNEIDRKDSSGSKIQREANSEMSLYKGQPLVWIVNNLTYAESLNEGSSKQAPAGFMQLAVQRALRRVRRLVYK